MLRFLQLPTEQIIALLIEERDKLNRAIEALQGPSKRRGRPPKQVGVSTNGASAQVVTPTPARKKRTFTAAQRKAAAERMRQYWAAKRKTEAKPKRTAKAA